MLLHSCFILSCHKRQYGGANKDQTDFQLFGNIFILNVTRYAIMVEKGKVILRETKENIRDS